MTKQNTNATIAAAKSKSKTKHTHKKNTRLPSMIALEPRVLFDGAALATAVDVQQDTQATANGDVSAPVESNVSLEFAAATATVANASDTPVAIDASQLDSVASITGVVDVSLALAQPAGSRNELIVVDGSVNNLQSLLDNIDHLNTGRSVLVLDPAQDELSQLNAYLQQHRGEYDAIHLFSHGGAGYLQLGTQRIDASSVNALSAQLQQIGEGLSTNGDLLVYGCNVAASTEGQQLVQQIAQLTRADVAASTDVTGQSGDWVLENSSGSLESANLVLEAWQGDLAGLSITSVFSTYNESSSLAAFRVDGATNGAVYELVLTDKTTSGISTQPLSYSIDGGATWNDYSGSLVAPTTGSFLVAVPITVASSAAPNNGQSFDLSVKVAQTNPAFNYTQPANALNVSAESPNVYTSKVQNTTTLTFNTMSGGRPWTPATGTQWVPAPTVTNNYYWAGVGTFDKLPVVTADQFGGALKSNYLLIKQGETITLTLDGPTDYLGFWWSAANAGNKLTFYRSGIIVATFDTAEIYSTFPDSYRGANWTVGSQHPYYADEKFAFLNFTLNNGLTFDKVAFSHNNTSSNPGGFELDNITVRAPSLLGQPEPPMQTATASGVIVDDGTGSVVTVDANGVPVVSGGVLTNNLAAVRDNDTPPAIIVNNITVNEASPYAVFTVKAIEGASMTLQLSSGSAQVNTDTGVQLQYYDPATNSWLNYTAGSSFNVPASGTAGANEQVPLLVRVSVNQDAVYEGPETFTLTAAYANYAAISATGTGTIVDDGTGVIYTNSVSATNTPVLDTTTPKDNELMPVGCYLPVTLNILANDYIDNGALDPASVDLNPSAVGRQTSRVATYNGVEVGEFKVSDDGIVLFTPNAAFAGNTDAITYSVADMNGIVRTSTIIIGTAAAPVTNTVSNVNSLELFLNDNSASRTITTTGTGTSATQTQTLKFALNANNPTDSLHTTVYSYTTLSSIATINTTPATAAALGTVSDPLKVTATVSNLVYGTTGMQLGNDSGYTTLGWDAPSNAGAGLTSALSGTGLGLNTTNSTSGNTGFLVKMNPNVLSGKPYRDANGISIRYDMGRITVNFSQPLTNPLMNLYDLGGYNFDSANPQLNLSLSTQLKLVGFTSTGGLAPQLLEVSDNGGGGGLTVNNANGTITRTDLNSGYGNGAVQINGSGITSLTFDISLWGTNTSNVNTYPNWVTTGAADWFNLSFSTFVRTPEASPDSAIAVETCGVNNVVVNEGSPFAVFQVKAYEGEKIKLDMLADSTGEMADIDRTKLEFWNGTAWVSVESQIDANQFITVPSDGDAAPLEPTTLLVRIGIVNDAPLEISEDLHLQVTYDHGEVNTGTLTILDNGQGDVFATNYVNSGIATDGTPLLDTGAVKNNDGAGIPIVNSVVVNEASPYAVFKIDGVAGAGLRLALSDGTALVDANGTPLTDGTEDYGNTLQVFNGTAWVNYDPANTVVGSTGALLVRVAIVNDLAADNGQVFNLKATYDTTHGVTNGVLQGASSTGTGTIMDDGTGSIFVSGLDNPATTAVENPTGVDPLTGLPLVDTTTPKNADRISVNDVTVNEASPYAVFTVNGIPGNTVSLALADGTALGAGSLTATDGSQDYGTALEVFDGTSWVTYSSSSLPTIDNQGLLLVRVAIKNDAPFEGPQTYTLTVTDTVASLSDVGLGTIVDDGTGTVFASSSSATGVDSTTHLPVLDTTTPKNDDRGNNLIINNLTVNEASPYMVFTVTGLPGAYAKLDNASGTAVLGADTGTQWQVYSGGQWVDYTMGSATPAQLNAKGELLVRVAVTQDAAYEVSESYTLKAQYTAAPTTGVSPPLTVPTTLTNAYTPNGQSVTVYTEVPGQYTSTFANTQTFSFNSVAVGTNAATTPITWNGVGTFTEGVIGSPDRYGGAVDAGVRTNYIHADYYNVSNPDVTLELNQPADMFGAWWSAGGPGDVLTLYSEGAVVASFTTDELFAANLIGTTYKGSQPGWTVNGTNPYSANEYFVYLNVVLTGGLTFDKVVFSGSLEADNFTVHTAAVPAPADSVLNMSNVSTGVGTILDNGTGDVFLASNTTGDPNVPADAGFPAQLDDDRPLDVTGTTVNEASPYVLWNVDGAQGQLVQLTLQNGTATVGVDTANTLEYFNGTSWVAYIPGSFVEVPTVSTAGDPGVLMVRATPVVDTTYEMSETVLLQATNASGTSVVGESIILDDGTGAIYGAGVQPLVVTGDTVQESASPLGFTVTGKPGDTVTLSLQNGTGTVGVDTANRLEYLNGTSWEVYSTAVAIPNSGALQVRVAVTEDSTRETSEAVTLVATGSSGIAASGDGIILDNESAGAAPVVNSIQVNEASPYAVFTVDGLAGAGVTLALANGTAGGGTDFGTAMEVFNGTAWVAYDPATTVIAANGKLLVRMAITNDTPYEVSEQFTLTATYDTGHGVSTGVTNGASSTGTGTILDNGTGTIFLTGSDANPTTAGVQPNLGVDANGNPQIDNSTPLNDDRTLAVNNLVVNEGSPYTVFTVTAVEGEKLMLDLSSGTADIGIDTGSALEYFDGANWVAYQAGTAITVPSGGTSATGEVVPLLVRVAIVNDVPLETTSTGGEIFTLTATYATGTTPPATGTCEILDNGNGTLYTGAESSGTPVLDTSTPNNNDNPLTITGQTVNEASPTLVFTVTGQEGQPMTLSLASGSGTVGVDTGTALEVFNGTDWVSYTPGQLVLLPSDGDATANEPAQMLVRVAVVNDTPFEGAETIQLLATQPGGAVATGVGTIVDDGTGVINDTAGTVTGGAPVLDTVTAKNNDIGANPAVNDVTVNEGSPYAVFTVTGKIGAGVTLNLADGTAAVGIDTGSKLQVLINGVWADYSATNALIPSSGNLLVRVAITQDTPYEVSENFSLVATYNGNGTTTGIAVGGSGSGTGTILDDGTGAVFLAANTTATPSVPTSPLDDDRPVSVIGQTVHEVDGFVTFTVSAFEGQTLTLALGNDTDPTTANATLGTDTGTQLQVWNGSAWVPYTGAYVVPADANGVPGEAVALQVRVAVNTDSTTEPAETVQLTATTASGKSDSGVGTILDAGTTLPADNRPLTVTGSTVNEVSPYLVFTVGGVTGQKVQLSLADGTAVVGTDTGTALEYFNGSAWTSYTPGAFVEVPTGNQLLVRVAVVNDPTLEGMESVTLVATNTSGRPASDQGYIVDDGTGTVFAYASNSTSTPNAQPAANTLNNDRALAVNNVTVNEASPYAVFTVTGVPGQSITVLTLADGTALGTASAGSYSSTGNQDYVNNAIEVYVGGSWRSFSSLTPLPTLDANGTLLARVAVINDVPFEGAQTFTLTAATSSSTAIGTGAIIDDGTGVIFAASSTAVGVDPSTGLPLIDVLTAKNDDRSSNPLVNSVVVNEVSKYAVFTVEGVPGAGITLALGFDSNNSTPNATLTGTGADIGSTLEVFNGTAWVAYSSTATVVPANGTLLVRVAVVNDTPLDTAEVFTLTTQYRTTTGMTLGTTASVGTGTIMDDGTGTVFASGMDDPATTAVENPTGVDPLTGLPLTLTPATGWIVDPSLVLVANDDRPLTVNDVTVNEGSPFIVFTVTGVEGQYVKLGTESGTAVVGTDTGTALEYFNGTAWVAYIPGSMVQIPSDGDGTPNEAGAPLLVRLAVTQDTNYEISESFKLTATNAGGSTAKGVGTIVDNGTGNVFLANNTTATPSTPALADDDRPLTVTGTTVADTVAGNYVLFNVDGVAGQLVKLDLVNGVVGTSATIGTDTAAENTMEYWNGTTWTTYNPATNSGYVSIPTGGTLAVRIAVTQDATTEGTETLSLQATNVAGTNVVGTSLIVDTLPPPTLSVTGQTMTEGTDWLVFTVDGQIGRSVNLALATTGSGSGFASLTADLVQSSGAPVLEYFDGTNWVPYSGAVQITTGQLLVRTQVVNDTAREVSETLQLVATDTLATNVTASGVGTILDNPADMGGLPMVNSFVVNEASPFGVFTVNGVAGAAVSLTLSDITTSPNDHGSTLEYFDAASSSWLAYNPAAQPLIQADGTLLVRFAIVNDVPLETVNGVGETLSLSVAYTAQPTSGTVTLNSAAIGTAMIMDDGTGTIFLTRNDDPNTPANETNLGVANNGVPQIDSTTPKNDDRSISVNNVTVNEASPYIVFQVGGKVGDAVTLTALSGTATLGTDTGTPLEYFNGTSWETYNPGSLVSITRDAVDPTKPLGTLLVRLAVTNDNPYEMSESFTLTAQNTANNVAVGVGTIVDNGTGLLFSGSNTSGTPDALGAQPDLPTSVTGLNDDRPYNPAYVNNLLVNEGSPYVVFTVTGVPTAEVTLAVTDGTATVAGGDYTSTLEVFNGTAWVTYNANTPPVLDSVNGALLVRVPLGNQIALEGPETLKLDVAYTGGVASGASARPQTGHTFSGYATIVDDGTGTIFATTASADGVTNGVADVVAPATTPVANPASVTVADDDRPLLVNNVTVNESSPYIVFTVTGKEAQYVKLQTAAGTALLGTGSADDANPALQYWNGSAWLNYTADTFVQIPSDGNAISGESANLLVRLAVTQDVPFEGAENFTLTATNTGGGAATGTGTIVDDGTGVIFAAQGTVLGVNPDGTPTLDTVTPLNDDRVLSVNNVTVDEGSAFAVFSVTANPGQTLSLSLTNGTAVVGADTGTALEYWNGSAWVSANTPFTVPGNTPGTPANLLVRVAITADAPLETINGVGETFNLVASYTSGVARSATGVGTIIDDGSGMGTIFATSRTVSGVNSNGTPTTLVPVTTPVAQPGDVLANDDRPVLVNSVEVNEASPYLIWIVTAKEGQYIGLAVASGTASVGADTGTQLQFWNGSQWLDYLPGMHVKVPGTHTAVDGELLVRLAVTNDSASENLETLTLLAANVNGTAALGLGGILDNDATDRPAINNRSYDVQGHRPWERRWEQKPIEMGQYEFHTVVLDFKGVYGGINQFRAAEADTTRTRGLLEYSNHTPYTHFDRVDDEVGNAQRSINANLAVANERDFGLRNVLLPPVAAATGGKLDYRLPSSTFTGGKGDVKLTATQKDGTPLPTWLKFNSKTGHFEGEPPADMAAPLEVRVVATDDVGGRAETKVRIKPEAKSLGMKGKPSFTSQIMNAVRLRA